MLWAQTSEPSAYSSEQGQRGYRIKMKKKTLLLLLLCAPTASQWLAVGAVPAPSMGGRDAIPVSALRVGGSSQQVGQSETGIAFFMPDPSLDFSDLDVRDAQNNKVQSPSASEQLETLFRENLVNLMVFASPHAMTEALSWLDSLSRLFNKLIFMRVSIAFGLLQDVFLPPSRRFVHNVHNLWITFSVGLLMSYMLLSSSSLQRSPLKIHLRC